MADNVDALETSDNPQEMNNPQEIIPRNLISVVYACSTVGLLLFLLPTSFKHIVPSFGIKLILFKAIFLIPIIVIAMWVNYWLWFEMPIPEDAGLPLGWKKKAQMEVILAAFANIWGKELGDDITYLLIFDGMSLWVITLLPKVMRWADYGLSDMLLNLAMVAATNTKYLEIWWGNLILCLTLIAFRAFVNSRGPNANQDQYREQPGEQTSLDPHPLPEA